MAVTESGLAVVFDEWTDQLPAAPDRLGEVERRVRRHRTRVRLAGAAAVCAVLVAGVLVAGHRSTAGDQHPAVRRGPSHPALTFPGHFAGSVVSGQVSGFGQQTRTTTLTWPASKQLALVMQCSAAGGMVQIVVTGQSQPLYQPCAGLDTAFVGDGSEFFPQVRAGSVVTLEVSADAGVVGPWAVGVLARDPHWLTGGSPAATLQGKKLQMWLGGGTSGTVDFSATGDTRPVFVLTCGQPGRLSLLINGHDVGTVNCADAAWSAQVLPVSAESLASAGWVPGRKELLALGWEGMSWAYVGVAVYSD
ncbi:MAG: hypothetical protein ACHQE5_12880 [Actinomycetes bacterium]